MDNINYKAKFLQKIAMKEGDVVSASLWNSILNTIISESNSHAAALQEHTALFKTVPAMLESIKALQATWTAWQEKYSAIFESAEQVAEDAQEVFDIYQAMAEGLVHIGSEPPESPKIKIWINPDETFIPIERGPQGPQGPQGEDYVLTEADKAEIAARILANFTDVSEVGQ